MKYLFILLILSGCATVKNKVCAEYTVELKRIITDQDRELIEKYHWNDVGHTTQKIICTKWE